MSGSCALSKRQITLLLLMAQEKEKGRIWIPWKRQKLNDEEILIGGASDANCVKSLWRRGLAIPVGSVYDYSSEITQEGCEWVKVLNAQQRECDAHDDGELYRHDMLSDARH